MQPLLHAFYLVNRKEHDFPDYLPFLHAPGAITLHDDFIGYMWDTLSWIPTLNPARHEQSHGLSRWGPTVITTEGALQARVMFRSWADMLSCGPATLALRSPSACASGSNEKLQFQRDDVVRSLRGLEASAATVAQAEGEKYILHLGI